MLLRYFEALLLVLQKIPDSFDLRQFEKRIQVTIHIEEDIEGMYPFLAFGCKVEGVALEYVGEVGAEPVDLIRPEGMHIILCYERSFALSDPGQLYLLVPVEMGVEVG
jgi:hypothetical protein